MGLRIVRVGDWWERAFQVRFKDEEEYSQFTENMKLAHVFLLGRQTTKDDSFIDFLTVEGQAYIAIVKLTKLDKSKEVSEDKLPDVSYGPSYGPTF